MHSIHDILRPEEVDIGTVDAIHYLPPEPPFHQTLNQQRVVPLTNEDLVLGAHDLIGFAEIQRYIYAIRIVDLEDKIKETFQFFHVLAVVLAVQLERH